MAAMACQCRWQCQFQLFGTHLVKVNFNINSPKLTFLVNYIDYIFGHLPVIQWELRHISTNGNGIFPKLALLIVNDNFNINSPKNVNSILTFLVNFNCHVNRHFWSIILIFLRNTSLSINESLININDNAIFHCIANCPWQCQFYETAFQLSQFVNGNINSAIKSMSISITLKMQIQFTNANFIYIFGLITCRSMRVKTYQ